MNWVFVFIAFTAQGAVVEKVHMDSASICAAYGQGYSARPELRGAHVEVAQCVSLRSGVVIPVGPSWQAACWKGVGMSTPPWGSLG